VPPERKKPERERPKLAPALPFIDAILEADRKAPRKQRHTARRIWTRLRQEMPEVGVGESTVREYVRQRKAAMGLLGQEVFVPQSYQFGGEAQVDGYEIFAEIDGQQRKVYIFCMRSTASGATCAASPLAVTRQEAADRYSFPPRRHACRGPSPRTGRRPVLTHRLHSR